MPSHRYEIIVHCVGLRASVKFNGCSVFRTWGPEERGLRQNLSPWVIERTNHLEAQLQPFTDVQDADASETELSADGEPDFFLTLHRVAKGDSCNEVNRLLKYHWTENEGALKPDEAAQVLSHRFFVDQHFGRWEWQRARPYEAHRDRVDVEELVVRFHKALEERDAPTLNAMLGIKLAELGHALDIPLEQMQLDQAKYFEMYFDDDRWTVMPLDMKALTLESDAGGRLVHMLGQDGAPPLIGFGGGRPFGFPLTLSNIDDSWLIVR